MLCCVGNLIISLRAVRLDEVSGGCWLLKTLSRDRDGIRQKKQQIQNSTAQTAAPADKPWGVHQVLTHGTGEGTAAYATFLVLHASDIIMGVGSGGQGGQLPPLGIRNFPIFTIETDKIFVF